MSYELKKTLAALPQTTRGRAIVLGGDPKGKNFLYCNGIYVFIRDVEDVSKSDVYCEHAKQATVAKYAPSGFYIASGDVTGKVRIWDTTQIEHILKYEYQPISGALKDIAWSPDSKRVAVAGEGREKYAHVFLWDSGSTVGDLSGHTKYVNSIDYKPTRPYRITTGSEDYSVGFFEGPPFKYKQLSKVHSNFVNTVRYSPDGEFVATGGADGKVIIHGAKTYEVVCELGEGGKAHKGGIYAMCWSADSTQLLTVSGDKSAKIFDVKDNVCKTTFQMGTTVNDMQVGCLWQGDNIITVSLSGYINYLDVNNPDTPKMIVKGHNKLITAMVSSEDGSTLYTAGTDGRVIVWDVATGKNEEIGGHAHSNQVNGMAMIGDKVASIGMDDTLRFFSTTDKSYMETMLSTNSQPRAIASSHGGLLVVACISEVNVYRSEVKASSLSTNYEGKSVAIHPDHKEVAVGGNDNRIYIYNLDTSDVLEPKREIHTENPVNTLKYSPNGTFLCTGTGKVVNLYNVEEDYKKEETSWQSHAASINQVSWSPDNLHIASCSLDTGIIVWSVENKRQKIDIKRAHPKANIRSIQWLSNTTLASAADDCCIKIWDITHH